MTAVPHPASPFTGFSGNPRVTRTIPLWMPAMGGFIALVAAANITLVWLSGRGHRDLVRPDYYAAGLAQDSLISLTSGNRTWAKSVALRRTGEGWFLEASASPDGATGALVRLYRPDDGRADMEARLARTGERGSVWGASFPNLKRGRWIATVVWEKDGLNLGEGSIILDAGN